LTIVKVCHDANNPDRGERFASKGAKLSALLISLVTFIVVMGGALFGGYLRTVLPKHHLSEESKDVVKVGIAFLATLSALVLGLLLAAAKNSFDTKSDEILQAASKIVLLDRNLRQYGPDANGAREKLRQLVESRVGSSWLEGVQLPGVDAARQSSPLFGIEEVQESLRSLSPASEAQRLIHARALQLAGDLAQMRWLVIEQRESSIPMPFLVILIFWAALIATCIAMYSPRNATVTAVAIGCSLSIASAIFLILEMDHPFHGLLRVSDAPLRTAITFLER